MITVLAQQTGTGGGGLLGLLPLLLLVVLFYFMLIRPQQRRARAQRELISAIEVGDMVVTIGGFHGTVRAVHENTIRLELSPSVTVTLSKQAVARRVVESGDDDSSGATASEEIGDE